MNTNQSAERKSNQLMPFTYKDHAVNMVLINDELWFIAKDVCDVLGLGSSTETLRNFPANERFALSSAEGKMIGFDHATAGINIVNEPGLYRLIFQSRKPEAEKFKTWIFNEVLPQIRKTGSYGSPKLEGEACAGRIYQVFSACQEMTIQRMNKIIYYFALEPPLANTDIAKLLGVSAAIITLWRKRLSTEMARKAVRALAINAQGIAVSKAALLPAGEARPGFPLELPAKEFKNE